MKSIRYVTAKEMKEIDKLAIEKYGILASRLMENAGKAVADEAMKMIKKDRVTVFSGYGNNGGDGFVAARHLINSGYDVEIFLVGKPKPFSPETETNFKAIIELDHKPENILTIDDIDKIFNKIRKPDLIIDAIFGIGLKGELDDFYITLIDKINSLGSPIISVDLPSGLDSDTGRPLPNAIRASKTVTLGLPKIGFKNPDAKTYTGEIVVADISLPANPSLFRNKKARIIG